MQSLLAGIEQLDFQAALRRCEQLGDAEYLSSRALESVPSIAPLLRGTFTESTTSVSVSRGGATVMWYQFELLLWALGESLRRVLKGAPALRREQRFWERAEELCERSEYGKGRESWVMLLGQYGGPRRVPALLVLANDPEIAGHVLYALRRLKAPEGRGVAERLQQAPQAWIRQEAKKYLALLAPGAKA